MNIFSTIGTLVRNHVAENKGVVKIVDTESNIISRTSDPQGTMALATDTDQIYIHTGGGSWVKIQTETA